MLAGNERLIVVLGMAHSGTTILAYVLKQHPKVHAAVNGGEAWILENNWLPREQSAPIQELLNAFPYRRILLKRPWNCVWHGDWMAAEMPKARFLYCYRDFEEISASWSKRTSFVHERLRNGGSEHQREHYEFCWQKAQAFGRSVSFFRQVYHPEFVQNPAAEIKSIGDWLGLDEFGFDVSEVGVGRDIKRRLRGRGTSAELGARSAERKTEHEEKLGMESQATCGEQPLGMRSQAPVGVGVAA